MDAIDAELLSAAGADELLLEDVDEGRWRLTRWEVIARTDQLRLDGLMVWRAPEGRQRGMRAVLTDEGRAVLE